MKEINKKYKKHINTFDFRLISSATTSGLRIVSTDINKWFPKMVSFHCTEPKVYRFHRTKVFSLEISFNHWFKNNDDAITILKKRVDALEKFQNEALQLLKQLNVANTSPPPPTQLPDKDQIQEDFGSVKEEEEKPVNNDTIEKKEQIQSDSTTTKSEITPFTIIDKETVLATKANEEETVTPSKTDDTHLANASLSENELHSTTNEDDKNVELTEKPEKLENLNVASNEFDKLKIDESVENEENQKFGKSENVTTESIEQTTEQTNEKDKTQDNSD
ncbi:hypothetical protein WN51_09629 [Melipona quadrifasciata]|uniref:Uncharacterized protein n=1 Tax=Melipona quadrifasciata TaxID=166423 RepID=A0A0M8ZN43_9HYME|nr:hypothetical protein WN51_09629 [Melipona quadrifasciata]